MNKIKRCLEKMRRFLGLQLGDSTIIKCMPLMNTLTLFLEEPPVLISIFDFSDHVSEGGKTDAAYIGQLFKEKS